MLKLLIGVGKAGVNLDSDVDLIRIGFELALKSDLAINKTVTGNFERQKCLGTDWQAF